MATRKQLEYIAKWKRENQKAICFRLNKETDAKLIQVYESIPDKAEWFKQCLRVYANIK